MVVTRVGNWPVVLAALTPAPPTGRELIAKFPDPPPVAFHVSAPGVSLTKMLASVTPKGAFGGSAEIWWSVGPKAPAPGVGLLLSLLLLAGINSSPAMLYLLVESGTVLHQILLPLVTTFTRAVWLVE
jgi:hypothetical protein